ncbi:GNAT family N-acetyltransferase [Myxococcota bacterium]|nr:GNAT family N-acetyltransferase [Myxococcota bacterium]
MPSPDANNTLRDLVAADREPLELLLRETGAFTPEEVDCALELLDLVLNDPSQKDYHVIVSTRGEAVAGYVLFGPVPLTLGTFDVYWIATSPSFQNQGHGRRLMVRCEEAMRDMGGRLVCIETSSQESYVATQAFYTALGYEIASRIRDFYKPGDDRLTYVKRLTDPL